MVPKPLMGAMALLSLASVAYAQGASGDSVGSDPGGSAVTSGPVSSPNLGPGHANPGATSDVLGPSDPSAQMNSGAHPTFTVGAPDPAAANPAGPAPNPPATPGPVGGGTGH